MALWVVFQPIMDTLDNLNISREYRNIICSTVFELQIFLHAHTVHLLVQYD